MIKHRDLFLSTLHSDTDNSAEDMELNEIIVHT